MAVSTIGARAAVLKEFKQPFEIMDVLVGPPREDEIRVRLVATGICNTDLHMAGGALRAGGPVVLGHEGAGVVEAVGDAVTTHAPGDHVVLAFAFCGRCDACRDGAPTYCEQFMSANFSCCRSDGSTAISNNGPVHSHYFGQSSFATHAVCNAISAIKVPKDLPLELLGPLGCGVSTGAGAVLNALKVTPGSSFAVFGAGAVGLSGLMAARVAGATQIIAIDRNAGRLALARELGATDIILVEEGDLAQQVLEIAPKGVDFTLDTTGVPAVITAAVTSLARRGTCGLLAGGPPIRAELPVNFLFSGGRSIRGVTEGDSVPALFIPRLIELYRQGRFPFDKLVQFFPFEEINTAMAMAASGEAIKPIVRF